MLYPLSFSRMILSNFLSFLLSCPIIIFFVLILDILIIYAWLQGIWSRQIKLETLQRIPSGMSHYKKKFMRGAKYSLSLGWKQTRQACPNECALEMICWDEVYVRGRSNAVWNESDRKMKPSLLERTAYIARFCTEAADLPFHRRWKLQPVTQTDRSFLISCVISIRARKQSWEFIQ